MGPEIVYTEGQTPLDEDEIHGLLIPTIATRSELDEFEQQNIEQAVQWTIARSFRPQQILSENFIRDVHKRMFGEVWAWAGEFRQTEKNIGTKVWLIATELKQLLDDTIFWMEHSTYPPDEIAVRFKHRLVSIHCFANGNGRHSRLLADIIIENIFGRPPFSWGATSPDPAHDSRAEYLTALKAADKGDIEPLIGFARS
jgi:Fic-DOC domain mobile mystery protein B